MRPDNFIMRPPSSETARSWSGNVLQRLNTRGTRVLAATAILALGPATAEASTAQTDSTKQFTVSSRGFDTRTGIHVRAGETIGIGYLSGKWTMNRDVLPLVDANGHKGLTYGNDYCKVVGTEDYGKVIVRIDGPEYHDPHYAVGNGAIITSPVSGEIVAFPNDRNDIEPGGKVVDCRTNNKGQLTMVAIRQKRA